MYKPKQINILTKITCFDFLILYMKLINIKMQL